MGIELVPTQGEKGSILLEPLEQDFYASDHFGLRRDIAGSNFVSIGQYFFEHFLCDWDGMSKAEPARGEVRLVSYRTPIRMLGRDIEEFARRSSLKCVWLADIASLIKMQLHGEDGFLDIGYNNLFFAKDNRNDIHIVHARFHSKHKGWAIGACPVQDPDEESYSHSPRNEPLKWEAGRKCIFKV